MTPISKPQLRVGGTVRPGSVYIIRDADEQLFLALSDRLLCTVLAPRQVGKSSLRLHVANRLEKERGFHCATVDLSSVGTSTLERDWYVSIAVQIAKKFHLPPPYAYWKENEQQTQVHIFQNWIIEKVVRAIGDESPIAIFFDEIDVTLSLSFDRSDFFGMLRSLDERKASDKQLERLTFCIVGVATPLHLVPDSERTPFNTAKHVRLRDFEESQLMALSDVLRDIPGIATNWIQSIFHWTNGHPAYSIRLCQEVIERYRGLSSLSRSEADCVADLVKTQILDKRKDDPIWNEVENKLRNPKRTPKRDRDLREIIENYTQLLKKEQIQVDLHPVFVNEMRIFGLIHDEYTDGKYVLRIRNRIFRSLFNESWVKSYQNSSELSLAATQWKENGESSEYLLKDGRLKRLNEWIKDQPQYQLSFDEQTFVVQSEQHALQEAERIRRTERRNNQIRSTMLLITIAALSSAAVVVWITLTSDKGKLVLQVSNLNKSLKEQVAQYDSLRENKTALDARLSNFNSRHIEELTQKGKEDIKCFCRLIIYMQFGRGADPVKKKNAKSIKISRKLSVSDILREIAAGRADISRICPTAGRDKRLEEKFKQCD